MKRIVIFCIAALVCAGIGRATYQATLPPEPPPSRYVPAGALLYLEAQDFPSLLAAWNSSTEKKQWVASSNYEMLSRSRLLLRLKGASDQFAAAAGLPANMNFLAQVAGRRSALALYDIGNLEFLYVTYLPSAKSMETALWQTRAKFEPRKVGGVTFYVRHDPESQKEVAFAVSGDYLLLATREDLLASALQLMAGNGSRTVESEPWWSQSVASAGTTGDLRMVMNLEKIVPSPYFRSYWVQQNITDMKQYSAAVSDLFRSGDEYREERVLLRKAAATPRTAAGLEAAASLVRLVPEDTGLYEVRADPSADTCFDLLVTKLLAPHLGLPPASEMAPQVQLTSGETGNGSDLETRIDQPAVDNPAIAQSTSMLRSLLGKTSILAALQVQSTERDPARVFVGIRSAIVLTADSDWNDVEIQAALTDYVRPSLTASQHGLTWEQKSGYSQFDGLWPLVSSIRGKYLIVSDDPALVESMLANFDRKSELKPAVFVAGFNHRRERANFVRLSGLVDRPNLAQSNIPGMEREPQFFSENMASLSSALSGVSAEKLVVRDQGDRVMQTVTYEWSR
jgi:hypothetical protein